MSQEDYTIKTIKLFGFVECNSYRTSMSENVTLFTNMGALQVNSYLYQKMIGKLFFILLTLYQTFHILKEFSVDS
jgi:hypothetical protein